MFRRIARGIAGGANTLFKLHPLELSALLEAAWEFRVHQSPLQAGHPNRRSDTPELPRYILNLFDFFSGGNTTGNSLNAVVQRMFGEVRWHHLIYAYMIENIRVYEIFEKVLFEYLHGERLGPPLPDAQHWLRNTEELFYRDPAPFSIYGVVSDVRPDKRASRRNAYYRMFGMELNHGAGKEKTYNYQKPEVANREFVATFEAFLREVWIGISNVGNASGSNPTDNAAIANLARQLSDMLRTRRQNGNLSRQEFWYVAMMSWFHLTIEPTNPPLPIIASLRAEAPREDQVLFKVAERVGQPVYSRAYDLFQLAEPMSRILTQIEMETYNNPAAVPALYTEATNGPEADMRTIITHWSLATGKDMKVRKGSSISQIKTSGNGQAAKPEKMVLEAV